MEPTAIVRELAETAGYDEGALTKRFLADMVTAFRIAGERLLYQISGQKFVFVHKNHH